MRLGMIGVGHMGSAILSSVLDTIPDLTVSIASPVPEELQKFPSCFGTSDNTEAVRRSDFIVLAVRPNILPKVLREIAPFAEGKTFLSIAAGVTIASIRAVLPAVVLRAMPNTPLSVGKGAVALTIPDNVSADAAAFARRLFTSSGIVEVVSEDLLAAATSLNGSGPGYFFRIAEVMTAAGVEQGLSPNAALRLTAATMAGAAEILLRGEKSPSDLKSTIAVPGGTTAAAFDAMDVAGFDDALRGAVLACAKRAEELSK